MKKNAGFSLVELLIVAGIMGVLIMFVAQMFTEQQKMMRAVMGKSAAETVNITIKTFLQDPNSCAATVQHSNPSAPTNLSLPININAIIQSRFTGAGWVDTTYFNTGVPYDGFQIDSIVLRDFQAGDVSPGPKFSITYELTGATMGAKIFQRNFDAFVNYSPSTRLPAYSFQCADNPLVAPSLPLTKLSTGVICDGAYILTCPVGTNVVSCGTFHLNSAVNPDGLSCTIDPTTNTCRIYSDKVNTCDAANHGECYCR